MSEERHDTAMGYLDKFNDWYVRTVPESGPGISVQWMEPVAGSRYRWKAARGPFLLILAGMFVFMLLPLSGKNHSTPAPLGARFLLAVGLAGAMGLITWALTYTETNIFLTAQRVKIGTGRSARRIWLDSTQVMTLKEFDGFVVLVLTAANGKQERIYLDPASEQEVKDLLSKAGKLTA